MNPFEKIFNYQILSRLSDTDITPVTEHERSWLKSKLELPAAQEAFSEDTLQKLKAILQQDPILDTTLDITEKASSQPKHPYPPLLSKLQRLIRQGSGIRLSYEVKDGQSYTSQRGVPYKLEYSIVKREWYLLWYHLRLRKRMSTRLEKITELSPEDLSPELHQRILHSIKRAGSSPQTKVVVEVVKGYHKELSRILYAFSCFEKQVEYRESDNSYRLHITLPQDELEYLLSKVRFLGKRVQIPEDPWLRQRMYETTTKALARYGFHSDSSS